MANLHTIYYRLGLLCMGLLFIQPLLAAPIVDDFEEDPTPKSFILYQNYPNPFNPATTIKYELKVKQQISIKVYNMVAQEVEVLVDEIQDEGMHTIKFDASSLPSGVYFYRLETKDGSAMRQMILLK